MTDLKGFGERQIRIDCDVIQADGGTRTASITGGWIALYLAFKKLLDEKKIKSIPLSDSVAAISCGIYDGVPVLDLDYAEDSNAQADANFVLTGRGGIVEIQGTAETEPFSRELMDGLLDLAMEGTADLASLQQSVIDG